MKIEDFSAKKRTKSIAYPRQIAMYLSRELTDFHFLKLVKNLVDVTIRLLFMRMKNRKIYKMIQLLNKKLKI